MAHARCEISVVIPAYREAERITETLRVTCETLDGPGLPYEIIVVDDGSPDNTSGVVRQYIASCKGRRKQQIRLISYHPNQGKGFALKRGSMDAVGKYIAFLDADLDISPDHIVRYYDLLKKEKVDAVLASKRHPGSVLEYARIRKIISNVYYLFNRIFFRLRVKDTQSGMKIFRREVLMNALPLLLVKRFAFDLELLVNIARKGAKIIEAPMKLTGHTEYGRFGLAPLWHAFVDTMAIFFRLHILRYYNWPVLPLPARPSKLALFILAGGFSEKLVSLVASLRDSLGDRPEIFILDRSGAFTIAGARVISTGNVSTGAMLWGGLKKSRAKIIGIIDEDIIFSPGWLLTLDGYFKQDGIDAVAGPSQYPESGGFSVGLFSRLNRNVLLRGRRSRHFRLCRQRFCRILPLVNSFFRREVLEETLNAPCSLGRDDYGSDWISPKNPGLLSPELVVHKHASEKPLSAFFRHVRESSFRKGRDLDRHGTISFRDLLPSFGIVLLLVCIAFSVVSGVFREFFLWSVISLLGVAYISAGRLFKFWRALPVLLGIIGVVLVRGGAMLSGIFSRSRKSHSGSE